ncbi:MAG TPA: hypothetical protein VEU11_16240 [Terriglobales bacterium]|nr:hypothetical protein [Terriglobales bacterium]
MIASPDDARLLFRKWQQDSMRLHVKLRSSGLFFDANGTVTECTPETLQLGGDSWQFTIPLHGAEFTFSDPREVPLAGVREAEAAQYEFGLSLKLLNGDELVILEMKASAEPEAEPEP